MAPKMLAKIGNRQAVQFGKRFVILCLIVLVGVLFASGEYGLLNILRLQAKIRHLQREIKQLKVEGADLAWQVAKLENDSLYIMLYAAEHYGYAKPAPMVIQFVTPK